MINGPPNVSNQIDAQTIKRKAVAEEMQQDEQKKQHAKDKLDKLANKSDSELFRIDTIFPFDLFPDTIIIDATKVSIINRNFFDSECVTSIPLRSITEVTFESALLLAQMSIKYAHLPLRMPPITIKIAALPKKEAIKAKEILEGIIVLMKEEDVEITSLNTKEIVDKLQQIGRV